MLRRQRRAPGFRVVTLGRGARHRWRTGCAPSTRTASPFYMTSRGITNEVYYAAQKAARFLGTNHVDNSARLCHAASTVAMKATLGYGASTCSYADWLDADLIVFFGSNAPNNQPVTTKYLHYAKQQRRADRRRQHLPRARARSATGCRRCLERRVRHAPRRPLVRRAHRRRSRVPGRRAAGAHRERVDRRGVRRASARPACEAARDARWRSDWAALEAGERRDARARCARFARLLVGRPERDLRLVDGPHAARARRADRQGADERRRWRAGCPDASTAGLVPIRGHSGVQGGAEVGCAPGVDAATLARWERVWGFPVPRGPRLDGGRDDRSRGRRRRSTSSGLSAATSSRRCRRRRTSGARSRGRACASTRTSCCPRRCWLRATATC